MRRLREMFKTATYGGAADIGLLVLRIGVGLLMMTHGWPKYITFSEKAEKFYDFIGLGGEISLALTVFAELCCSAILILGLGTRIILVPLIILAAVIVIVVHGPDAFGDKEHGLLFLIPYITLMFTGPGKYSLDYFLFNRSGKTA
jgi:putative oxidoreductase